MLLKRQIIDKNIVLQQNKQADFSIIKLYYEIAAKLQLLAK